MAVKGAKKPPMITWNDVLKHTQGGWSVFANEIPGLRLGEAFCSPLRKDRHASCGLTFKDGVWFMKDFANGDVLTALQFIQKKYGLIFSVAVSKMAEDYGLKEISNKKYVVQSLQEAPKYNENEVQINWWPSKWRKEHYKFWENTEVDKTHCEKHNTFAIKELAINRRIVKIGDNEVVWCYYAPEQDRVKIYFPEREREKRFKNNIHGQYIWELSTINQCDKLIVHKSMKDLIVSSVIFPCNISTQNESIQTFTPELVSTLNDLSQKIYIFYGADDDGKQKSIEITKEHGYKWVNTKNEYLKQGINDAYSLVKAFGIKELEALYKYKHIL